MNITQSTEKRKEKKGYITLEAAIFLPIFIVAVLTLGYFIKIYSTVENVAYAVIEETGRIASHAYSVKSVPLFRGSLESRISSENKQISKIRVEEFQYLYSDGYQDDLISAGCRYEIKIALPLAMAETAERKNQVKCRGFTGEKKRSEAMPFEEMEREGTWDPVWIFPMSGKKYHSQECRYVRKNARQMVLTSVLKKQYRPCELCRSGNLPIGGYVYCFTETGYAYHRENCKKVDKYTIEIDKEEAQQKGYRPCSLCKGG